MLTKCVALGGRIPPIDGLLARLDHPIDQVDDPHFTAPARAYTGSYTVLSNAKELFDTSISKRISAGPACRF